MKYISTKKISSYLNNKKYTSCSTTGSLKGMKKLPVVGIKQVRL